jgi:NOL1/NOP2/fmu family ribosome biogenesis protein
MQNLTVLNSKQNKELLKHLTEQFGITEKLPYVFLLGSNDKIFLIKREVADINLAELRIDTLGMYFGQLYKNQLRLSIEGCQIIGKKATKGIIEISERQMHSWMLGEDIHDIELAPEHEGKFLIVTYKKDILGCGKYKEKVLYNYVTKTRMLKTVNV